MIQRFCTSCGNQLREDSKFCTNCGSPVGPGVAAKIEKNSTGIPTPGINVRNPMSKRAKFVYFALGAGIAAAFVLVFMSHISDRPHPVIEKQQTVAMESMYTDQAFEQIPTTSRVENGKIIVPLTAVLEKKIIAFDYEAPSVTVPLLVYISNEGKLVTAIRFCEPCNSKNFRIESKEMVCGNCGTRWSLNNLKGISGTCQKYPPEPIPSQIIGNEIQIDESLVKNWKLRI